MQLKERCQKEMSKSSITNVSVNSLKSFNDITFCKELDEICPVLSVALRASSGVFLGSDRERFAHRAMCYGILFKARYGCSRASIMAHRNDQLFVAAGVKKTAFRWFNKLGVTTRTQQR